MSSENAEAKSLSFTNVEFLLKLGSAILGSLYVLGLLISNVQLMEVGISDFTSLQVRNVMTGILFLFYIALFVLFLVPIDVALYVCWRIVVSSTRRLLHKVGLLILVVCVFMISLALIADLIGLSLGYLFPWGRQWEAGFSANALTWQFQKADFLTAIGQFAEAFWHLKLIVASFFFMILLLYPVAQLVRRIFPDLDNQDTQEESRSKAAFASVTRPHIRLSLWLVFLALFLSLVGFAQEVYPNMTYNLGGGQPDVEELQIGSEKPGVIRLLGITTSSGVNQTDSVITTEHVVIWYQSDKFLYVAPISRRDQTGPRLIALDIKMVRAIQYLPEAVHVGSGGRILGIRPIDKHVCTSKPVIAFKTRPQKFALHSS